MTVAQTFKIYSAAVDCRVIGLDGPSLLHLRLYFKQVRLLAAPDAAEHP